MPFPQAGAGFGALVQLHQDNVLKIVSVFLHGAVLLIFLCTQGLFTRRQLALVIKTTIVVAVLVGFWETAAKNGLSPIPFPAGFFYSNAGYTMAGLAGHRTNFTFTEPSYAGGFFAAMLVAYWGAGRKCDYGTILLLIAAFILSLAGTSFVTLVGGLGLLFLLAANLKNGTKIAVFLMFLALILLATGYFELYFSLVAGKLQSFSGRERMAGNLYGLRVFTASRGLGVGMGTVRTFSLLTELLSSLGVPGFVLYFGMQGRLLAPLLRRRRQSTLCRFALLYVLAHLVAQCAALPDLTTPTLWLGLFLAACADNAVGDAAVPAGAPAPREWAHQPEGPATPQSPRNAKASGSAAACPAKGRLPV